MIGKKLWYIVTLVALVMLPLAGCSGGGSNQAKLTEKGTEVTVGGKVSAGKLTAKAMGKTAIAANTVEVYNAQDGATLGTAAVAADGSFTGLSFTLPATKAVLVFKATVAQGTFLSIVPIDLSNPPAAGTVTGANPITIVISQESTATAQLVSQLLGLTGDLGDAGQTIASLNDATKTYAAIAQLVVNNGGQQLAYGGSGLAMTGKFSSAALLPALDANNLDANALNNTILDGSITSVAIPGSKPIVSFQVINKTTGKGIRGLKNFNLAIAQLKPAANGSPSEWLSYMVTPSAVTATNLVSLPGRPSTDAATASSITVSKAGDPVVKVNVEPYSVIDNGDGSYTVVFGKNIKTAAAINQGFGPTYDANLTHRLMVGIRTTPSVALLQNGSNLSNFYNEKYFISDFVPATPGVVPAEQRNITATDSCNECHTKIGVTTPHGGRGDVKYCMMCHTAQRAYGRTNSASVNGVFTGTTYVADGEVSGDFVTMVHKIHMGNKLTKTGYDFAGVKFNEIVYPKDVINCRQCHKGDDAAQLVIAAQANNWKEKPSRKSCGSCHDNINFATGANAKVGGAAHAVQADDSFCASCHGTSGPYPVETFHTTVNATPNNPNVAAGLVNFFYEVSSASVAADNTLSIKFRIQKNTGSLSAAKTNVVFDGTATAPLIGFTGGPSFLLAYNLDNANQPAAKFAADYNNAGVKAAQPKSVTIGTLLGATTGTLGTPDASGYYTATVNSASAFPVGAKLRAIGLQGYFTQAAGTGGIAAATARHALSAVKSVSGDAVRREVIDSAKCSNCHEWFEGHGGNRVIGKDTVGAAICTLCHVPNLSTSGKGTNAAATTFPASMSATEQALLTADGYTLLDPTTYPEETNNFKDMIHGIHAGSSRTNPLKFVRDRGSVVMYFSAATFKFPGILQNCAMCHKGTTYTSIPAGAQVTTDVTTNGTALDLTNNVSVVSASRTTLPNATDLVSTPFTATCAGCHDAPNAKAHFKSMGGQLRVPRSAADPAGEACVTCHGATGPNSLWNTHRFTTVGE